MSQFGQKVVAVIDTTSAFGVTIKDLKDNQTALQNQVSVLLNDAPETLDTLNEIAAAIADDPAFFTTMSSANTTLQNNIAAVQADVDANEVTASNLVGAQNTAMLAAVSSVQADVDQNESDADTATAAVATDLSTNYTTSALFETNMINRELWTHGSLYTESLQIG